MPSNPFELLRQAYRFVRHVWRNREILKDTAFLDRTEAAFDVDYGTYAFPAVSWIRETDMSTVRLLELGKPEDRTFEFFHRMINCDELKSYTPTLLAMESEDIEKGKEHPYDVVVVHSSKIEDLDTAMSVCSNFGVIILNTIDTQEAVLRHARIHGCGAVTFYSDISTIDGLYRRTSLVFRSSAIFR